MITMATWQVLRQLRHMAALATDVGGTTLFAKGAVLIGKVDSRLLNELVTPALILQPRGREPMYTEIPFVGKLNVGALIVVENAFDPYGTSGMVGSKRESSGSPTGYGTIQIADELERDGGSFRRMGAEVGLSIVGFTMGHMAPQLIGSGDDRVLAGYEIHLTVIHANQGGSYPSARAFTAIDAGSGDANLAWTLPPARYDNGGVYIRRASGGTPPATTSDGDEVGTFDRDTTSNVDNPGAGEFSYSVWGAFDPDTEVDPGEYPSTGVSTTYSSEKLTATVTVT